MAKRVQPYNTTTEVEPFRLRNILPMRVENYFRYSGSLTTPGCDEIVNWVVVESPVIKMSEDQLVQLQTLQNVNGYPVSAFSSSIHLVSRLDRLIEFLFSVSYFRFLPTRDQCRRSLTEK